MVMNEFSVVLPIHNEEENLKISLSSVFKLNPTEVLILLDRCTDGSLDIINAIIDKQDLQKVVKCVTIDDTELTFRSRFAFLRTLGCKLAQYDIVLITAADLVLDPIIVEYVPLIGKYGLITFDMVEYPVSWRRIVKRLLARILPLPWLGGVRIFDRRLLQYEDLDELKTMESGEDTHLADAIRKVAETLYILTNTIHLRPREDKDSHYLFGKLYWQFNRGFWLTLASALALGRLNLIEGYLHARIDREKR